MSIQSPPRDLDLHGTGRSWLHRITALIAEVPALARNGLWLIVGSLIASALGLVFWSVAARQLSPEQVGIGAALVSTLTILSNAAQLNLRNLVNRFVPGTGLRGRRLILQAYAVAATGAFVLGSGFVLFSSRIAPDLAFLGDSTWIGAGFVAAIVIWTLYSLQETTLIALRLASLVPLQSLIYSALKIVVLVGLTFLMGKGGAVLLAWVLPALVIGLFTHVVASRRFSLANVTETAKSHFSWRMAAGFFGWDYLGTLATSLALGIAPLLVLSLAGPEDLAHYYIAWSFAYVLYLVGHHLGAAMLTEVALDPARRRGLFAEVNIYTLLLVLGGATVFVLGAPLIMSLFGAAYVEASSELLIVLALSSIPGAMITAYLAICRAQDRVRSIAVIQASILVIVVVLGSVLTSAFGVMGMAFSWLCANVLVSAGIMTVTIRRGGLTNAAVDLASAAARIARKFLDMIPSARSGTTLPETRMTIAGTEWTVASTLPTLSDAQTQHLYDTGSGRWAYLKSSQSALGRRSLAEEYKAVQILSDNPIIRPFMAPVIHFETDATTTSLLLEALPGRNGGELLQLPGNHGAVTRHAVRCVDALHASTATLKVIDAEWVSAWIERPIEQILTAIRKSGQPSRTTVSGLLKIKDDLRTQWLHKSVSLGFHHGDYCPSNITFQTDSKECPTAVNGLLDSGGARLDGPAGLDDCILLLAMRMRVSGDQFGQIVLELFGNPSLSNEEMRWFQTGSGTPDWRKNPSSLRGMVLLAWLQHIAANLHKSERYRQNKFWCAANISLVAEDYARATR